MKIKIGSDHQTFGTAEAVNGQIEFNGNEEAMKPLVEHYAIALHRIYHDQNMGEPTADNVLQFMIERMNGRTWTEEVV